MPIIGSTIITGSLPAIGSSQWGGAVNGFLELFGQVLSQLIGVNSIQIDGDLDMRSQALLNLRHLLALNGTVDPDSPCTVYFKDDEFYVRDGAGNVVQLTLNGTLNAAALGGFTGDYGSSTGDANYSAANSRFTFSSAPGEAAAVDAGPLRVRNGSATNVVALNSPAALSASYTLTFPSGTPVEDHSLLRVSTVGIMQTTRDPSLNSVTGSMFLFSREGSAHTFVASGSDGRFPYRHPPKTFRYPPSAGVWKSGGAYEVTGSDIVRNAAAGDVFSWPLHIHEGERLRSGSIWVNPAPGCGVTASWYAQDAITGATSTVRQVTSAGTGQQVLVLSGTGTTRDADENFDFIDVTFNGVNNRIHCLFVSKDKT